MKNSKIKIKYLIVVLLISICSSLLISCNSRKNNGADIKSITIVIENIDYKSKGILYGHEKEELYSKYFLDFNDKNLDMSNVKVDDILNIKYKEINTDRKPATIIVESFE